MAFILDGVAAVTLTHGRLGRTLVVAREVTVFDLRVEDETVGTFMQ